MAKAPVRRDIRCYLCGHRFEVSLRTMSVPCPKCNKALKVEDVHVKSYLPVTDLQTCGKIVVSKGGRVVAKLIRCGDGIECEGVLEGIVESDGEVSFGPKASWKGKTLQSRTLAVADGAQLMGIVRVPWTIPGGETPAAAASGSVASAPTSDSAAAETAEAPTIATAASPRSRTAAASSARASGTTSGTAGSSTASGVRRKPPGAKPASPPPPPGDADVP